MTLLILLFAFAIGYATFIENDFGRASAISLVFSAWWFEAILILLESVGFCQLSLSKTDRTLIVNSSSKNNWSSKFQELSKQNTQYLSCKQVHTPYN